MTDTFTTNYGFTKIDFNARPWNLKEYANWDLLDTLIYTIAQIPNIGGTWRNSSNYTVGQNILDPNTLVFYQCVVANTSAATGTFAADRAANPSYWTLTNPGQGTVRYDQAQALTTPQLAQAINNLQLYTTLLRFDAAQTLTYNQMLQVLNTLGIDGTESTVASAATTDIGNANTQCVAISGTNTITSFGARPNKYKLVRFTGSLTLTNSSTLNLPGGANIVTQPGDTCVATSDGTTPTANWTIRGYSRADGSPLSVPNDVVRGNSIQTFTTAQQKNIRDSIGTGSLDDLRTLAIQVAKIKNTSIAYPNYISDDFNDLSGVDTVNSVNATLLNGAIVNQFTDTSTKALLHFNGANNSTTISDDVSGHSWVANGGAKLSTAQPVFGSAALLLTTTGDYVSHAASTDFGFGTGDFTINLRINLPSVTGTQVLFDNKNGSGQGLEVIIVSGVLRIYDWTGATYAITGTTTLTANTPYDIEINRTSGSLKQFINGTQDGSTATNNSNFGSSNPVYIGRQSDGTNPAFGTYDEFRLRNVSTHNANFTIPTTAFAYSSTGNLDLRSIAVSGGAAPTKASIYIVAKALTGTINLNTNLIAKFTRTGVIGDAGAFTLALDSTIGGNNIYKGVLDVSGQPSGTIAPRYEILTNDLTLGMSIDAVDCRWG